VDLAIHIETGQRVELSAAADTVALSSHGIFAPGREHGHWLLPGPRPTDPWSQRDEPIGQAVSDGRRVAMALDGRIASFVSGEPNTMLRDAAPLPWFPPATDDGVVYWADSRDQEISGTDLWAWDTRSGPPVPFVTRPGDQRHVVASDGWIAWTDADGLWLHERASGLRWLHRADTGFRAGPSLDGSVACWEERDTGDIDVRCSDGLEATGEGDQGWPSRWGPWLLVRDGDMPWLITAEPVQEPSP